MGDDTDGTTVALPETDWRSVLTVLKAAQEHKYAENLDVATEIGELIQKIQEQRRTP